MADFKKINEKISKPILEANKKIALAKEKLRSNAEELDALMAKREETADQEDMAAYNKVCAQITEKENAKYYYSRQIEKAIEAKNEVLNKFDINEFNAVVREKAADTKKNIAPLLIRFAEAVEGLHNDIEKELGELEKLGIVISASQAKECSADYAQLVTYLSQNIVKGSFTDLTGYQVDPYSDKLIKS